MIASPQFQLVTLGRLALLDGDGVEHELTKRRRMLAVLAYLAVAGRPVPRDQLATLFWPDEDDARARHSLSNALSSVRAALGRSAVELGRFEVALVAEAPLEVDLRVVARAAAAQDWGTVLQRTTGVFMDGVVVQGSHAFEEWASAERRRIAKWVEEACRAESPRLLADGAWTEAAAIGDRWLAVAPLSGEAALARLQAELGDGDAEALRRTQLLHERMARRAQQEFGEALDPRVGRWVGAQVARPTAALPGGVVPAAEARSLGLAAQVGAVADGAAGAGDPRAAGVKADVGPATETGAELDARAPGTAGALPRGSARWPRRALAAGGVVLLAALAIGAARLRRPAAATPTRWVLVADLENAARDTLLNDAVPLALRVSLAQSGRTEVVSRDRLLEVLQMMRRADTARSVDEPTALEAAARMGADVVLIPTAARTGGATLLGVRLLETAGGRTLFTTQIQLNSDADLLAALDELARRTRAALGEQRAELRGGVPLPAATTTSVAGLRAFADGLRLVEAERPAEAIVEFQTALLLDSTFARANASLGLLYATAGEADAAERYFRRALGSLQRLPPREAFAVEQSIAIGRRDWAAAATIAERHLRSFPRDREARRQFTYALFRLGRTAAAVRSYRTLLEVDSLDAETWIGFASALPLDTEASRAEKLAAYSRAFQLNAELATGLIVNQEYGGTLLRAGLPDSAEQVFRRMLDLDISHRARGLRSLGHLGLYRGEFTKAAAAFGEATQLEKSTGQSVGAVRAQIGRATALAAVGRGADARAALAEATAALEQSALDLVIHAWVGKALIRNGDQPRARIVAQLMARRADPARRSDGNAQLLLAGELAAADGDLPRAAQLLDSLWRQDSSSIVLESRAYVARLGGQHERAQQLEDQLAGKNSFGWEGMPGERAAPYWSGIAAAAAGDTAAARSRLAEFVARFPTADSAWTLLADARARLASPTLTGPAAGPVTTPRPASTRSPGAAAPRP